MEEKFSIKKWFSNILYTVLYAVAEYIRKHNYYSNVGKFKYHDLVTWNWRAKILLKPLKDKNKVYEVAGYYENGEGINTKCGEMISAHWLKKVR